MLYVILLSLLVYDADQFLKSLLFNSFDKGFSTTCPWKVPLINALSKSVVSLKKPK